MYYVKIQIGYLITHYYQLKIEVNIRASINLKHVFFIPKHKITNQMLTH